jgi:CBS-domain-containing membrane protein
MGYLHGAPTWREPKEELEMIGILLTVLVAALVYLLLAALTGSAIVAIIGAILVLIAGIPSGGFGLGDRWGGRRGTV